MAREATTAIMADDTPVAVVTLMTPAKKAVVVVPAARLRIRDRVARAVVMDAATTVTMVSELNKSLARPQTKGRRGAVVAMAKLIRTKVESKGLEM